MHMVGDSVLLGLNLQDGTVFLLCFCWGTQCSVEQTAVARIASTTWVVYMSGMQPSQSTQLLTRDKSWFVDTCVPPADPMQCITVNGEGDSPIRGILMQVDDCLKRLECYA